MSERTRSADAPDLDVAVTGASADDERKLRAISRIWVDSYLCGDLERFVALMHDDIVVMAQDEPTIRGKKAAREFFASRVGTPGVSFHDTLHEIRVHGDWAVFLGDFVFERAAQPDGTPARRRHGRYFVLYEKTATGEWKMLRDMDNALPAT